MARTTVANRTMRICNIQIFATKAAAQQADTGGLEWQIDKMVYKLYSLTEEEVRVVEGKE